MNEEEYKDCHFIEDGYYINQLEQENERLKGEKEQLNSLVNSCQKRIRKQNNIIKEVREYIENK